MENAPSTTPLLVHSLSNDIGPVTFTAGQLEGRRFRAVLTEIQKAEVGRKYSRKDRRPLDPPPVAELKLFEIDSLDNRIPQTEEIELLPDDDVSGYGVICHVDLFPVPETDRTETSSQVAGPSTTATSGAGLDSAASASNDPFEFFHLEEASSDAHPLVPHVDNPSTEDEDRIVAVYGDQPITEGSKLVNAMTGTSTMHSVVLEFENRRRTLFVFSVRIVLYSPSHRYPPVYETHMIRCALSPHPAFMDIAVKIEGRFFLRYRAYNILGTALSENRTPIPVIAECYGEPFTVYSTNDFPGLRASTELTKRLSDSGIRVNRRDNERRRRKNPSAGTGAQGGDSDDE